MKISYSEKIIRNIIIQQQQQHTQHTENKRLRLLKVLSSQQIRIVKKNENLLIYLFSHLFFSHTKIVTFSLCLTTINCFKLVFLVMIRDIPEESICNKLTTFEIESSHSCLFFLFFFFFLFRQKCFNYKNCDCCWGSF